MASDDRTDVPGAPTTPSERAARSVCDPRWGVALLMLCPALALGALHWAAAGRPVGAALFTLGLLAASWLSGAWLAVGLVAAPPGAGSTPPR